MYFNISTPDRNLLFFQLDKNIISFNLHFLNRICASQGLAKSSIFVIISCICFSCNVPILLPLLFFNCIRPFVIINIWQHLRLLYIHNMYCRDIFIQDCSLSFVYSIPYDTQSFKLMVKAIYIFPLRLLGFLIFLIRPFPS